jgi:hypothetical protein
MRDLKFIGKAVLAIILSVYFISCSDDDGENPESNNLGELICGTWVQDGDDDIFVFNADGTGVGYENIEFYEQKEPCYAFTWTCNNEWVYLKIDFYGTLQEEELRPESISTNKMVWRRYMDREIGDKDAFGWYRLWTWERYSK